MRDLDGMASSVPYHELQLETLTTDELARLRDVVTIAWSDVELDADDALVIRFEWLMPLIDAELRRRPLE